MKRILLVEDHTFFRSALAILLEYQPNLQVTQAGSLAEAREELDGRFDVPVNQALPFGVGNTKWEVLLGIRNLFRDPNDPASMYDELLVVRPPKRVLGGFLVRF